jgi:hypothetical protein
LQCNDSRFPSPTWEGDDIISRRGGDADGFQFPLVCFTTFENHFCGHEQECARVYRGTFAADNPLKFSEELGLVACMAES